MSKKRPAEGDLRYYVPAKTKVRIERNGTHLWTASWEEIPRTNQEPTAESNDVLDAPKPPKRARASRPPLRLAEMVTSFFCSKKTCERVIAQIVADIREEHSEALAASSSWKARWIVIRGYWAIARALRLTAFFLLIGKLVVAVKTFSKE